jgi:hypothetical protein
MRKFPKGYSILYQPNEKRAQIRGHPSGQIFRSSGKNKVPVNKEPAHTHCLEMI